MMIDNWRKKLRFRAWHRGTREMDLILGSFADAHIDGFDAPALEQFEHLLGCQDPDLYDWKCERGLPGPEDDNEVMRLFLKHKLA